MVTKLYFGGILMRFNRSEYSRFVQRLDRTAEKNPVLWLPCIILLAVIVGFGDTSKSGWDAVISEIDFAPDGSTVKVNMNGMTELPKAVVSHIQNRSIILELSVSGAVWTIDGLDVTEPKTVDLRVSNTNNTNS